MTHWSNRARCREEDPELFFPVGNSAAALSQTAEAKAVCRRCPVVEQCLQWALLTGQDSGVWGGLSEDERRNVLRVADRIASKSKAPTPEKKTRQPREIAPCGTLSAYKRHTRNHEAIDAACREAHNAENRRLRNTGTTKVPA